MTGRSRGRRTVSIGATEWRWGMSRLCAFRWWPRSDRYIASGRRGQGRVHIFHCRDRLRLLSESHHARNHTQWIYLVSTWKMPRRMTIALLTAHRYATPRPSRHETSPLQSTVRFPCCTVQEPCLASRHRGCVVPCTRACIFCSGAVALFSSPQVRVFTSSHKYGTTNSLFHARVKLPDSDLHFS